MDESLRLLLVDSDLSLNDEVHFGAECPLLNDAIVLGEALALEDEGELRQKLDLKLFEKFYVV